MSEIILFAYFAGVLISWVYLYLYLPIDRKNPYPIVIRIAHVCISVIWPIVAIKYVLYVIRDEES